MQLTEVEPAAAKMRNLLRKPAIVTGSTIGIGLGIAQTLAEASAKAAAAIVSLLAIVGTLGVAHAQADVTMSKEILSVEVRKRGFVCANPIRAARDVRHSRPGETMWLLSCDTGDYRVSLVPKMAAKVEPVK
jgi:NAD(P)-dependent dehydrogenase (short-subunit alcohol dehydrogenase family)